LADSGCGLNTNISFHLGGGEGGLAHLLAQFRPSFEAWWRTMGTPELTDDVCRQLIDGVAAEAHGRDIAALVRDRDAVLLPLLELVGTRGVTGTRGA
jgi:carnitine 3-dehydrogenase